MKTSNEKLKTWFWIIFIAVPLLTGFLRYESAENEYDDRKHQVIDTQNVECGPEGMVSCERVDVWRDIKTGKIFTRDGFKNHRIYESIRIGILGFLYGLIACVFVAWDASKNKNKLFIEEFKYALAINAFTCLIFAIVL